jgi:hypothetical protein
LRAQKLKFGTPDARGSAFVRSYFPPKNFRKD